MMQPIEPMVREDVIRAVERRGPSRIPLVRAKWWGEGLAEQYGERLREFDRYPEDVVFLFGDNPVAPRKMNLPWEWRNTSGAHDSSCVIDDWAKLDDFIERLPAPANDPRFESLAEVAARAKAEDRYTIFGWWNLFFEKPWGLRGMENLMCDYYTEPENVHKLHAAMCDTYCAYIKRACEVLQPDGFWASDDLGHQTGPMMSPAIFHDLLFPYYKRVGDTLKACNMHFWLHSCGDNTLLLPDLIASGLTVFHPVQKHTMDEVKIAAEFGDRLTFLAGIDVQHTLQEKDSDGVREEVRFLVDTFDRPEGGMCIAAGNGIVSGTPFENIEAFLDEAVAYGQQHRSTHGRENRQSAANAESDRLAAGEACQPDGPVAVGPIPARNQMTWQKHELLMFCHFGIKTYYVNDNHMGTGEEDPGLFNPAGLDTRQWLKAAKAGGFKGIILTTKHHDGFCNWQTATTDFSVKSSPWKNGKGDVVRELADACHEAGMWFGLYLSVYDRNYSVSGKDKDAYCEYYAQQLTELCTNYGEIDELWFDGFGSQNMKVDWDRLLPIIKEHQPKAVIFGGGAPTLRWPGNERGDAGEPNWSVQPAPDEDLVVETDARWFPAEADMTAQGFWFWNRKPICSIEHLQEVYATSVGRGGVALINVPPNQDGMIDDASIDRLAEFKAWVDGIGERTVAPDELKAKASSVRGNDPRFGPEQALNGSYDSYWTTDDDVTTGHLEVDLGRSMDIDGVVIQEYIPLGQRVAAHRIEFWDGSQWCEAAAGTTIGYKRIHWKAFKAQRVRLLITQSRACPLINAFRSIFR